MRADRQETLGLAVLLAITLVFGFVVVPLAIGLGYGSEGTGLSPRAMPQLATAGIALALVVGIVQSTFRAGPVETLTSEVHRDRHPLRVLGAVTICMLFASFGFQWLGFYVGGVIMVMVLTVLLGVRNIGGVLVFPVLIVAAIYLIFELGLQVRLPKSDWFAGLPL